MLSQTRTRINRVPFILVHVIKGIKQFISGTLVPQFALLNPVYIFSPWRFTAFAFSKGFLVHNVLKGLDHSKFKLINSGFGSILENFYPSEVSVRVTGAEEIEMLILLISRQTRCWTFSIVNSKHAIWSNRSLSFI